MGKTALLAKTADPAPNGFPDAAELRRLVTRIFLEEYGGSDGLWARTAGRAADRIVEAIYSRH